MRVLVTGGRSDIGNAFIQRRVAMGDEVLTTATSEPRLEDLKERLKDTPNVEAVEWKLETPTVGFEPLQKFIDQRIDILIMNASPETRTLRRLHEYTTEEFQSAIDSNIVGNIHLLRAVLKQMVEQKFGRILYISSISVMGTSRYALYNMTKGAVEGLIRTAATEYGEYNIYSNIIRPGIVATKRNQRFWKRSDFLAVMTKAIPAMKLGTPSNIAEASDPLLSETSYINGAVLEVAGGFPQFRSEIMLSR